MILQYYVYDVPDVDDKVHIFNSNLLFGVAATVKTQSFKQPKEP